MDNTWWVLLIAGITFYTLWVAGAFKKKKSVDQNEKEKSGG